jgi:hypothetical protein
MSRKRGMEDRDEEGDGSKLGRKAGTFAPSQIFTGLGENGSPLGVMRDKRDSD